jgi:uncharacterized membrane protein
VKKGLEKLIGILTILYPFIVFFALPHFQVWQLAVGLMILLTLRLLLPNQTRPFSRILWLAVALLCFYAAWDNSPDALRVYPVLVNFALLIWFASSLRHPPPVIETLARLQHPDLPPEGVRYTRKVTQIWCLFFLFNGLAALYTSLWCSMACWTLYNGVIAYVLMALLMAIEYLVRLKTQSHVR